MPRIEKTASRPGRSRRNPGRLRAAAAKGCTLARFNGAAASLPRKLDSQLPGILAPALSCFVVANLNPSVAKIIVGYLKVPTDLEVAVLLFFQDPYNPACRAIHHRCNEHPKLSDGQIHENHG